MPRGDRTGPWGQGPMTGRAAGFCAGFGVPGFMNPAASFGRGQGQGGRQGMGFGRGRGPGFGRGMGYGRGPGFGRGMGYGRGMGRGMPAGAPAGLEYDEYQGAGMGPDPRTELEALKDEAAGLEEALASVRRRMEKLETKGTKPEERV